MIKPWQAFMYVQNLSPTSVRSRLRCNNLSLPYADPALYTTPMQDCVRYDILPRAFERFLWNPYGDFFINYCRTFSVLSPSTALPVITEFPREIIPGISSYYLINSSCSFLDFLISSNFYFFENICLIA